MFTVLMGIDVPSWTDDMEPIMGCENDSVKCASLDDAMTIVNAHQMAVDVHDIDVMDPHGSIVYTWHR